MEEILARSQMADVKFTGLEEAMDDSLNQKQAPLITPRFLNLIQKWAVYDELPIEDAPPAILSEVEELHPMDGLSYGEVMSRVFKAAAEEAGGEFSPKLY